MASMKQKWLKTLGFLISAWFACTLNAAETPPDRVLTSLQSTYSLTQALLEDTGIEVVNVPEDGRQFTLLKDYIEKRLETTLAPLFASATAVVSVTNALPGDPLYRLGRDANIRLIDIDAAQPWSYSIPGVSTIAPPQSNVSWAQSSGTSNDVIAPYFWLSISNAVRMADIIGHDLKELFPQQSVIINTNLQILKGSLLQLSNEYQTKFLDVEDVTLFALANEFVYLTNDMGLYVDGYLLKQDIDWTEADLEGLTTHLKNHDIRVVLHKWEPSEAIKKAIEDGGAKLVVLDTADPGVLVDNKLAVDGLQQILKRNLELIYQALK